MRTAALTVLFLTAPLLASAELKLLEVRKDGRATAKKPVLSTTEANLVTIFATWCEPCRDEIPMLNKLKSETKGLRFVAVSVDDKPPAAVAAWIRTHKVSYPVFYADADVHRGRTVLGDTSGVPVTLLISAKGQVLRRWTGSLPERILRAALTPYLTP